MKKLKNIRKFCNKMLYLILIAAFLLGGCATAWKEKSSFYRTTQTHLAIESNPKGTVYVNNRHVGDTPLTIPLEYQQEVHKKTRKVSYWETQPGWSLFITIVSLGIYLPFSLIPVDIETSLEPIASFKNNEFDVRVASDGYKDWQDKVRLSGEEKCSLQPILKKGGDK